MSGKTNPERITKFAKALDAKDYSESEKFPSPSCTYEIRGNTIQGRDAIIVTHLSDTHTHLLHIDLPGECKTLHNFKVAHPPRPS